MDATGTLNAARTALDINTDRLCELVRSLPDTCVPIPDSSWTARDATAHLSVIANFYTEFANGVPSPLSVIDQEALAGINAALIADIPETDPGKLSALLRESTDRLLAVTAGRPGDQPVQFHAGPSDLARMLCFALAEYLVHGYDIAGATAHPWQITPADAHLCAAGVVPFHEHLVNPATAAGHTAGYGITLRGGEHFTVRFTNGTFGLEPAGGPVDCTIDVDPVAFLLIETRRLNRHAAITLGMCGVGGDRPDLAMRFVDLFIWP